MSLPPLSEKKFLAMVIQLARLFGWMCYHTHDSRRSAAGFPDLAIVKHRLILAELKTDTGRLTAAQEAWIEGLRQAGQDVRVWRPCMWNEIEAVLRCEP